MKMSNRRGVALIIALSMGLILSILAIAMLMLVRGHYGTTANQVHHAKAYYLAEAGIQKALARCRADNFDNFSFQENFLGTNDATITVTITPRVAPNNDYEIESKVQY